jgi:hypothetical protein
MTAGKELETEAVQTTKEKETTILTFFFTTTTTTFLSSFLLSFFSLKGLLRKLRVFKEKAKKKFLFTIAKGKLITPFYSRI